MGTRQQKLGLLSATEVHIGSHWALLGEVARWLDTRPELKKVGSTGSTLPEHQRFSPGTHKARNYLKDVWLLFQAICLVKIAQQINISLLVPLT